MKIHSIAIDEDLEITMSLPKAQLCKLVIMQTDYRV